jgi:hypothetical protein
MTGRSKASTPCSFAGPRSEVCSPDHAGVIAQCRQGEPGLLPVPTARQLATESRKSRINQQAACLGDPPPSTTSSGSRMAVRNANHERVHQKLVVLGP